MPAGGDGQRKPNFEPMKINTQMAKEVCFAVSHRFASVRLVPQNIKGGGESKIRWGLVGIYLFGYIFLKNSEWCFHGLGFVCLFKNGRGMGGMNKTVV